jgi:3-phosphoshikimate 1-carboxyvinyltransferase
MSSLKVFPSKVSGEIKAPPSKSATHRATILASLSNGWSVIHNPLESRDTLASLDACRQFGASTIKREDGWNIKGLLPYHTPADVVNVHNSGTTIRLLTAASTLMSEGFAVFTGDSSTRERPMQPLLDALQDLGVVCWSTRMNGCPPIIVKGGTVEGGTTLMRGDISSQFISALLISSPAFSTDTRITIEGRMVSTPYIEMTLHILKLFGINVKHEDLRDYRIPSKQEYSSCNFTIPGDFSSVALLAAVPALTGSELAISGLDFGVPQGDSAILEILDKMGIEVQIDDTKGRVLVRGNKLTGGEFDLSASPDLLPVVGVLAAKAEGETRITGVKHARFKESDRVAVLAAELPKLGIVLDEREDGLTIVGSNEFQGCHLDAHGDHRMFMAFCAAASGASEPCVVHGMESVDVSYPNFVRDLVGCGLRVEEL